MNAAIAYSLYNAEKLVDTLTALDIEGVYMSSAEMVEDNVARLMGYAPPTCGGAYGKKRSYAYGESRARDRKVANAVQYEGGRAIGFIDPMAHRSPVNYRFIDAVMDEKPLEECMEMSQFDWDGWCRAKENSPGIRKCRVMDVFTIGEHIVVEVWHVSEYSNIREYSGHYELDELGNPVDAVVLDNGEIEIRPLGGYGYGEWLDWLDANICPEP